MTLVKKVITWILFLFGLIFGLELLATIGAEVFDWNPFM